MKPQGNGNSVDAIIYEELRSALETQRHQAENLETKASVLIGFAGAILALLIKTDWNLTGLHWSSIAALIAGVILFLSSLILLYLVYGVRATYIAPDPLELHKHLQESPQEFRHNVIIEQQNAWRENNQAIERRARYLRVAFIVQSFGIFFVAVALLLMLF